MIVLNKYSVSENVKSSIQLLFLVNIIMENSIKICLKIEYTGLEILSKSYEILYLLIYAKKSL